MAITKLQLADQNLELRRQLSVMQAELDARNARIAKAIECHRANMARIAELGKANSELTGKLCGQIRRGNLLKARNTELAA